MRAPSLSYHLPPELIAQRPSVSRDGAKMLVLSRAMPGVRHIFFKDLVNLLDEKHLVVLNNTKVFPARLFGKDDRGREVEVLLVRECYPLIWEILAKPGRRINKSHNINFDHGNFKAEVLKYGDKKLLKFESKESLHNIILKYGTTPLPHYIKRPLDEQSDRERYQTVYAKTAGSCACPTAGIHFTDELLESLREKGVKIVEITLHIGPGTFKPIRTQMIEDHRMEKEYFFISEEAARTINSSKKTGFDIVAVGTSTVRALEQAGASGKVNSGKGEAQIFIYPGYRFRIVTSLITNFHQPNSTPLALVSAFAGEESLLNAYREAIKEKYRFFSYGDSMYIL